MADDVLGPNGLCFAPDESLLYVVESRCPASQDPGVRCDGKWPRTAQQTGRDRRRAGGSPDGMRCDIDGNLCAGAWAQKSWTACRLCAGWDPIGRIALPERCANVCFGGSAQPPVYGGVPIAVCPVRQYPGRPGWVRPGPGKDTLCPDRHRQAPVPFAKGRSAKAP